MTPFVKFLLMANFAVYLLQYTMPSIASLFVFVPELTLFRPWSVVTYMFLHAPGLMHIGFNMLTLYFFGPQVEARIGSRRFAILYFIGGISGALFSTIFSFDSPIIGASAGVFAVSLAFAYFWPTAQILIWGILPIQARVLVILTTFMAIYSGFGGNDNIAHFAHLGGYAGAFVYLKWLDRHRGAFKRRATSAPAAVTTRVGGWAAVDLSKIHEANRPEVSRIIEKIRTNGVGSLSYQEQIFLSSFIPPDAKSGG